jgi:diguanylate cyclase (GGDEF)-like protein/PAS domain S-box-containing protein
MDPLNHLYRKVLDNLQEGVYCVDKDRTITFWSKSAERLTGFSASEVVGTRCMDNILNHVDEKGMQLCREACPLTQCLREKKEQSRRMYLHHKNGHRIPVAVHTTPIFDCNDSLMGAVETFSDESAHIASIEKINELSELALLDPITRLGNRRSTESAISRRLEELRRYSWPFGLLFIDIDSFKMINDTFGHQTGDRALKMVGTTLRNSLRQFDFAGRWGGDEFVAILVNITADELKKIGERIRLLVSSSNVSRFRNPLWATVSVGATLARPEDTTTSLLKRADELMYQSKQAGKNRITCDIAGGEQEKAGIGFEQA